MSWYAVESLDEALAETRSLLVPVDVGVWVRLAVITLLAGLTPPQTPTISVDVPPQAIVEYGDAFTQPQFVAAALSLLAIAVVVVLLFAVIGAVMEFVLVDALRSQEVRVLAPFRQRLGSGLRLFGFRILVTVAVLLALAAVVAPVILAASAETPLPLLALVVTVPLLFVVAPVAALVSEFTTAFVVPLMAEHGDGVLDGWRRLWPTLRAEWREFAVYVLVKIVLLLGAGVVFSLAGAIVAVPVGIAVFGATLTPVALVAVAIAALVGVVLLAAVSVPVVTALRYHSLCTLAASEAEFTLR
ncbi:DUF7544 domain-containing protein [Halobacterium noricense]|uniref:DUF7544 domain-containing protein n=1 Tax=Halobacterium noricense TaxID=223182 RepID=UPI001E6207E1|nr:hypothetical protein [Halobacterium noricense]UHH26422.1 hypothetical protein LT974_05655 [Halobacterium noricense]